MKKIISCLLVAVMLAAMLVVSASAVIDGSQPNYGHVPTVEGNVIKADGIKDDAYEVALTIPVNTFLYSNYKATDTDREAVHMADMASGTVSLVYDGRYIWAFIEVVDKTLVTKAPDPLNPSYKEDGLAIMIDWENAGDATTFASLYSCSITHEGYLSATIEKVKAVQKGTVDEGATNPVTFLSGSTVKTDEGYNSEFRIEIPSKEYSITEKLSLAFFITDWNAEGNNRCVLSSNPNYVGKPGQYNLGQLEHGEWRPDKYGYVTFDYVPFTGDTTVIYVVIALVSAIGIAAATIFVTRRRNSVQ